ncbi:MAG: oxidoreductase [Cyanobacteriota bacterium]|nr:oxidoreductase [Cyanobacteriota bacterium]
MTTTFPQRWTAAAIPDLGGRVALVTGANSGLGLESARALAARGAEVVLACRSLAKAEQARAELLAQPLPLASSATPARIAVLELDLADLASVVRAAAELAQRVERIDLLLNNAGVMAPPRTLTAQGFELQFGVNHLGHYALTRLLLPLLRRAAAPRVVQVTSGAQYFGQIDFDDLQGERRYDRWKAYGQSKLANVVFAQELQRREPGLLSAAAHPGLARTNLQPTSVAANGSQVERLAYRLMGPLFQSAAQGAWPQLFALTAPQAEPGGHYGPSDLGGIKGWPKPVPMAAAARDPDVAQRFWQVSEALCVQALPGLTWQP